MIQARSAESRLKLLANLGGVKLACRRVAVSGSSILVNFTISFNIYKESKVKKVLPFTLTFQLRGSFELDCMFSLELL